MNAWSWLALIAITVVNIGGWAISYGTLKQKVKSMNDILNNGLVKKVDDMNTTMAKMEGRLNTYIELKEKE